QMKAEDGVILHGTARPHRLTVPYTSSWSFADKYQSHPSSISRVTFRTMKVQLYLAPSNLYTSRRVDVLTPHLAGRTRFDRLIHIGKCCVPLCVEALKLAVQEAKKGDDVGRYKNAWQLLRLAAPNEDEANFDDDWVTNKEDANRREMARLESELKGYKNNLIKESIRMGHEDLGHHLEETGHLKEAAEAYSRMRHDVSTTKHIMDCSQRLISVALQRRDWSSVLSNAGKISGIQGVEEERGMQPYTRIVHGIGQLGMAKFHDAAQSLLSADPKVPSDTYNDIATPNDVAVYGGLLALATMDRARLQTSVLDNQSFRTFLEHEPHIRKAISHFINGRYSSCLALLASYETDYLLDIYLQRHVADILGLIRRKCIVQSFVPFSCVTIESLDAAFGNDVQSVEPELVRMIRDGELNAKIDSKAKTLVAVRSDARLEMQQTVLDVAHRYEQEAKERLRRINLVAAGLEVSNPRNAGAEGTWYGDDGPIDLVEGAQG
ncbi:COP9 signalosome complex subunit 1, partial [Geosmithia morbida]